MKKPILSLLLSLVVLLVLVPMVALASDITGARWYSVITASNNSTAVDGVFTTFPLITQSLIDAGFVSANLSDCAMHDTSGIDTAFMPATNSTYPWCFYVNQIGDDAFKNYILYTGGNADMDGKLRYFPGIGGMTTADNATLELSDNFTVEMSGWIGTDNGTDKNLAIKPLAFVTEVSEVVSGNITATLIGAATSDNATLYPDAVGDYTNITNLIGAATHWEAVDDLIGAPDDEATRVYHNLDAYGADAYELDDANLLPNTVINSVTVYFRVRGYVNVGDRNGYFKPGLRLGTNETIGAEKITAGATWVNYNEALARPGGGTWTHSDIDDLQVIMQIHRTPGVDGDPSCTQVFVVVDYIAPISVTATGIASGEHIVTVTQSASDNTSPTSFTDLGGYWTNEPNAYDEDVLTWTASAAIPAGDWLSDVDPIAPLHLNIASTSIVGVQHYASVSNIDEVDLDLYYGGAWHDLYQGTYTHKTWEAFLMAGPQDVTAVRLDYHNGGGVPAAVTLWEMDFLTGGLTISIDGVDVDTALSATVPDNNNDWTFLQNNVMPYMEYHKIWIGGTLQQHIEYEYNDTVFSDLSGNSQDATPTFRTAPSDADVTAAMASFLPIEEAQAPAWVLEEERDFWDTENITAAGEFTTTPSPTAAPGVDIIVAISEASGTPSQLPFTVIAGFVILSLSLTVTWFMVKHGSRNLWLKIITIAILMGFCIAVDVFDFWMLVFFLIMAIAVALFSRQRSRG